MPPVRAARIHPYRCVGHLAAYRYPGQTALRPVSISWTMPPSREPRLQTSRRGARGESAPGAVERPGLRPVHGDLRLFRGRHHFLGRTGAILLARHRHNPVRNLRRLPRDHLDQRLPRRDLGAAVTCHRGTGRDWIHDSPAGRCAVHDHGCDHDGRRVGGRNLLPDDRAIPARQPGTVHPLFRGGGISRRNGRSPVPGGPPTDGGDAGMADVSIVSGTLRAVELGSGGRLRPRPLHRHEALEQLRALAGELRVHRRALSSGSGVPRHFRERRQGDGPALRAHLAGGLVARLRTRRSGTGRLGRGRDPDPQHAGSDPGGPAQPGHVSERHRAGRERGAGMEPGIQGGGSGQPGRRPGRQSARVPVDFRFDHQPQAPGRIAADRCCRQPCHGLRADLGRRRTDARPGAARGRVSGLHRPRAAG